MVLMEAQGIILYLYVSLGSGVSKHVYNHAWARIGDTKCFTRISSNSNVNLDDYVSPIPVENASLPPLVRFDRDDSSLSRLNSSPILDFIQSDKLEDLITTKHLEKIHR